MLFVFLKSLIGALFFDFVSLLFFCVLFCFFCFCDCQMTKRSVALLWGFQPIHECYFT